MPANAEIPSPEQSEQISLAVEALRHHAAKLNEASAELANAVAPIDVVLKELNLGVKAWVSYDGVDDPIGVSWEDFLGYAKVGGRWGLALSRVVDNEHSEEWLFNDAPRLMRVAAVRHIPTLLQKLGDTSRQTTEEILQSAADARRIATTLAAAAASRKAAK